MPSHTSIVVTAGKYERWLAHLSDTPGPVNVALHDFDGELDGCPNVAWAGTWYGSFNWGALANLAVEQAGADWLLFLHDDVTPPTPFEVELLMEAGDASGSGMVVPTLTGDCPSPGQRVPGASRWSHFTEYVSSAAFLVRRELLTKYGGFPAFTAGKSFEGSWLQCRLVRDGQRVAISHAVTLHHAGSGTWGRRYSSAELRRLEGQAAASCAKLLGIRLDGYTRLSEPRVVQHGVGVAKVTLDELSEFGGRLHVGDLEADIERGSDIMAAALNLSSEDTVEHHGVEYPRIGYGTRFTSLPLESKVRVAVHYGLGLGDCFFMMRAFAALRDTYPDLDIEVWTDLDRADLFDRCRDVTRVRRAPWTRCEVEAFDVHRLRPFGSEGAPARICSYFRVPYGRQNSRYSVSDQDAESARSALRSVGWREGVPTLVIQGTGGWRAKRWCHSAQLARQAVARGWQVWTPATDTYPRLRVDGLAVLPRVNLPTFVAALSLATAAVGFDSGVTHAAVAIGLPTVALFGPHDPRGIIHDADVYNVVAYRKRVPWVNCDLDCRALAGGASCPLRGGAHGGDCIDDVVTHEVWTSLEELTHGAESGREPAAAAVDTGR